MYILEHSGSSFLKSPLALSPAITTVSIHFLTALHGHPDMQKSVKILEVGNWR